MSDPRPPAGPVDPMTGDLTPVTVQWGGSPLTLDGRLVAPGLAITASPTNKAAGPRGPRYDLVHAPSGRHVVSHRCGAHIRDAADVAVGTGLDWTAPAHEVTVAVRALDLNRLVRARVGVCRPWYCVRDAPAPHPHWQVDCATCGWSYDIADDGPLTAAEAKTLAEAHRCEREVLIRDPATGQHHEPWRVNADGTIGGQTRG